MLKLIFRSKSDEEKKFLKKVFWPNEVVEEDVVPHELVGVVGEAAVEKFRSTAGVFSCK